MGCAAKMPLAITQPPLQLEVAGKSLTKASVTAPGSKRFDSISGRVCGKRIPHD